MELPKDLALDITSNRLLILSKETLINENHVSIATWDPKPDRIDKVTIHPFFRIHLIELQLPTLISMS